MFLKQFLLYFSFGIIISIISPTVCFRYTKIPRNPLVVFIDKNKTDVTFRWEWTLGGGVLNYLKIKRYEKNKPIPTLKTLVTYYSSVGLQGLDTTKFSLDVNNFNNGYASFVIKDITNQGSNQDHTTVDVMANNAVYVYWIELDFPNLTPNEYVSKVVLKVLKTPVITKYPQNQTASGGKVTFKCIADGKPKPTITWKKIGSSVNYPLGETLTLANFDASKIGVYRCTAKSYGITENATAVGYVQYSTCASGCIKEELGIKMTILTFTYEYEYPSYTKYKELKSTIEYECLALYAKSGKDIRKCEVQSFRKGSVVAVVELAWPSGTVDPKEPLLTAIKSGSFAGHTVKPMFVDFFTPPSTTPQPSTLDHQSSSGSTTTTTTTTTTKNNCKSFICTNFPCDSIIAVTVTIVVVLVLIVVMYTIFFWKTKQKDKKSRERTCIVTDEDHIGDNVPQELDIKNLDSASDNPAYLLHSGEINAPLQHIQPPLPALSPQFSNEKISTRF